MVGNDRLPSYADRESLPYTNALALEVLRWHSVTPTGTALVLQSVRLFNLRISSGVPHRVMEDNIHDGYLIPKGALVIANIWCDSIYSRSHVDLMFLISRQMLHDPEVYSDPTTFRPERFLGPKPEPDPRQICFGFGRRYGVSYTCSKLVVLKSSLEYAQEKC